MSSAPTRCCSSPIAASPTTSARCSPAPSPTPRRRQRRLHADADELFVLACFADEGPTLRRFRPRARGRATRIRKRTCHITIVVARMSDDRLEIVRARAEGIGGGAQRQPPCSRRAQPQAGRRPPRPGSTRSTPTKPIEDAADEISDDAAADEATEARGRRRRQRRGRRTADADATDEAKRQRRVGEPKQPERSGGQFRCRRVRRFGPARRRRQRPRHRTRSRATPTRCSTTPPTAGTTRSPRPRSGSTPKRTPKPPASPSLARKKDED